jgi:LmbE family N-acetylglucosaminyl deacetylase
MDLGTVLGVWAHPDDEAYLCSGLMAHAARSGERVVCVTATRGEGGSLDEERWPSATMGQVREAELIASLTHLGDIEHHWLDLPDISMDTALPEPEGAERVRELVAEVQPQTIVTFGPEGMTGHAAHMSVCRWATDAFHAEAPAGAGLYYATHSQEWADEWVPRLNEFDIFRPGTPVTVPRAELDLVYDLPPDILALKMRALSEHASQLEGLFAVFGEDQLATAMRSETFRLVATR